MRASVKKKILKMITGDNKKTAQAIGKTIGN
jgi:magnesium-transporting ATPase (P-type)